MCGSAVTKLCSVVPCKLSCKRAFSPRSCETSKRVIARWADGSDTFRNLVKIAGTSIPQRCGPSATVTPLQHLLNTSSQRVAQPRFIWTPLVAVPPRQSHPLSNSLAARFATMASRTSPSAQSQHSGVLEQEETQATIPLDLHTPSKAEGHNSAAGHSDTALSRLRAHNAPAESNGYLTLADRIKSRSRRNTSQSTSEVPSAAVHALAETVDAAIAPDTGASERYLDTRDADHNVPDDIPGASAEQVEHRQQSAQTSQPASKTAKSADANDMQAGAATPAQAKPKRSRKTTKPAKPALLQTAAQLAQSPDVSEDVLQENDKVRSVCSVAWACQPQAASC